MTSVPTVPELILAPWTHATWISRLFLLLQFAAILLGLFPGVRRALRARPWFLALVIGTPLFWVLFEYSVTLVFAGDLANHLLWFFLNQLLPSITVGIGTTLVCQAVLAIQYLERPLTAFPGIGVTAGVLAMFADILLVAAIVGTVVEGDKVGLHVESPSGHARAVLVTSRTGPPFAELHIRLAIEHGDTRYVVDRDLKEHTEHGTAWPVRVKWLSTEEILVERFASDRQNDVVFNTGTHTWHPR